ncbi:MAG: NUDIX domain-containing protein [Beijerinckiaceae bacterium]|nr:NUDIX domain-containing protein [Beijerinckiaceae bacterium]
MIRSGAIAEIASVAFRCGSHDWVWAREEADQIDAHWARRVAAQPGLFDGRVFLAASVEMEPGSPILRAVAFETDYRNFLTWRDLGFPGEGVFNLFSMGALRAADGAFIIGEMGPGTATAGLRYFPAGTPDLSDARDGQVDLEANALRELKEETGIDPANVTVQAGWSVVFDGARIACMKRLFSPFTANEIVARFKSFQARERNPELSALIPIWPSEGIDERSMPRFMLTYLRSFLADGTVLTEPS